MLIIADECLNGNIVRALRAHGFEVLWIAELLPGISDPEVILYATEQGGILISEDRDFGEWVFAHNIKTVTIIFLRYSKTEVTAILAYLLQVLPTLSQSAPPKFITISSSKVRHRML